MSHDTDITPAVRIAAGFVIGTAAGAATVYALIQIGLRAAGIL